MGSSRRKKRHRERRPARRLTLAAFVEWAASHRLWAAGATLALACIPYAYGWFAAGPARAGEILRMEVDEAPVEADLQRFSRMVAHLGQSVDQSLSALERYRRDFTNRPIPRRPVDGRIVSAGLAGIDSARTTIAEARGFVRGSTFFDPRLEARRPQLGGDLLQLDSMLVQMRRFYVAAGAGDRNGMRRANEEVGRRDQTGREAWSAAFAHLEGFTEAMQASGAGSVARLYESAERLRWYRVQALLAWGAVAYAVAFSLAAVGTWLRRRHAPAAAPARRR